MHLIETAKLSIDFSKVETGMPSNVRDVDMKKCNAPTLVMAAEKDCSFSAKKVIKKDNKASVMFCVTEAFDIYFLDFMMLNISL